MALTRAQRKSMAVGFGVILTAALIYALIWSGMRLPGFAGEVFRKITGIVSSPILIDVTIFLLGLVLILCLNAFIRARDGDEYVYLEQVEGPDIPDDMPEEARSAVFKEAPESHGLEPSLAAIEGALELKDWGEAADLLFKLPPEQLDEADVLALRLRLARAQGHDDQAESLEAQLRTKSKDSGPTDPEHR